MAHPCIPLLIALAAGTARGPATPSTPPADAQGAEERIEEPVARVTDPLGSFAISADDYFGRLTRRVGEQLLPHYARLLRLEAEATRLGVRVTPGEILDAFEAERRERIERAFGGDETLYNEEVRRAGRSLEGHRVQRGIELRERLLAEHIALRGRVVDEQQIAEHYGRRHGFRGHRFEGRVLSLPWVQPTTPAGTPPEEAQRRREASRLEVVQRLEDIRTEIRGGLDFSEAVRRHAQDAAQRERGGRPEGEFPPPRWPEHVFEDLVELELDSVSDPFFARGAFHLVWLDAHSFTDLESVREELRVELENRPPDAEEIQVALDRVMQGARVEPTAALFQRSTDPDDVVATLDRTPIRRGPFVAWMARRYGEDQFTTLLREWIVERAAAERGISVTAAEVEARLDREIEFRIQMFHRGDRERWLEGIERQGMGLESYRHYQLSLERIHLLLERIILDERGVSEAEVQALFEERHGPGGREVRVRFLRLDVPIPEFPPGADSAEQERLSQEVVDAAVRRAATFAERVRDDGEDFASLIRNHSDDPESAPQGGIPPDPFRTLDQAPAVREVIAALPVGGISEPVVVGRAVFLYEILGEERTEFAPLRDTLRFELEHRRLPDTERAGTLNLMMRATRYETLPAIYGG